MTPSSAYEPGLQSTHGVDAVESESALPGAHSSQSVVPPGAYRPFCTRAAQRPTSPSEMMLVRTYRAGIARGRWIAVEVRTPLPNTPRVAFGTAPFANVPKGIQSRGTRTGSQSEHAVEQLWVCWPGWQELHAVVDSMSRSALPAGQQPHAAEPGGVNVPAPQRSHSVAGL